MTVIKICGLTQEKEVQWINRYRPDWAGFVFAPSKRRLQLIEAQKLRYLLRPDIKAVGVFVNEEHAKILRYIEMLELDGVQLHGDEDASYIRELKKYTSAFIIEGRSPTQFKKQKQLNGDLLLLDHKTKDQVGGSGACFNWQALSSIGVPFILAGGLSEENIEKALEYRPYGVDVSSGVEWNGAKNPYKIKKFIEKVRGKNEKYF